MAVEPQPPRRLDPANPFDRLQLVQASHAAGDALVAIALAGTLFFDVPLGQARDRLGLWLLLTVTPYAFLSPVVGPFLDRWRDGYRVAVIAGAAGRLALAFLMASRTDRLVLYPMAFGVLVLSRAHAVSRAALVPGVLPVDRSLVWANSRLAVVSLLGGAIGALPGVGLQAWLGSGATLRLAGVVLGVAAVLAIGLPATRRGARRRPVVSGEHRRLPRRVVATGLGTAALRGVVGFLTFFLAFALRSVGEGGGAFAAVIVAAGIGGFAGSVLSPIVRRVVHELALVLAALVTLGVTTSAAVASFGVVAAALVAWVAGFAAAAGRVGFDSLLQRDAPEHVRGRAFARYETVFQLAWVGGAGLATAIPFGVGPGLRTATVLCLGGIIGVIAGLVRPADAEL